MTGAVAVELVERFGTCETAAMSARRGRPARLCLECGERHARFCYHGRVRADRQHTLCFECYRAYLNRFRGTAWQTGPATVPAVPRRARDVTDRDAFEAELRHRRGQAILAARRAVEGRPAPGTAAAACYLSDSR